MCCFTRGEIIFQMLSKMLRWDYLVELNVITSIILSEKGRLEGSHDGKGRRSAAKSSFPLLDLMGSSPCSLPTKSGVPPNL